MVSVDRRLTHPKGSTIVKQCMWLTLQASRQRASPWKVQFKLPTNVSVNDLPTPHKRKTKTKLQATRGKTEGVTLHTVRLPTQRVTENSRRREMTHFIHCQASKCSCICNSCSSNTHNVFSEGISALIEFISFCQFAILYNCGALSVLSSVWNQLPEAN